MSATIQESIAATQNYLRSGKNLVEFYDEHGIRGKTDGNHIILDYDEIKCNWNNPYAWACRGLVLCAHTYEVLGCGLRKFFNAGQGHADPIDWRTAKILTKEDGSLVNRWFSPHTNQFEITTRFQLPGEMAINKVGSYDITWKELFDRAMNNTPNIETFDQEHTVCFELCSLYNRIVVKHQKAVLRLLAARNNRTLAEVDVAHLLHAPKSYSFPDEAETAAFAHTLDGVEQEGFVVLDHRFHRIKIKGQSYCYLHKLKDSAQSTKSLIMLARNGEKKNVIDNFPEYLPIFEKIDNIIATFIQRHVEAYERNRAIETQKDFAIAVQKEPIESTALLFLVRAGKATDIKEALYSMEPSRFIKLMKPLVEAAGLKFEEGEEE